MKLKYKKLSPEAKTPTKAHKLDAGYDMYATSQKTLQLPTGPVVEYTTDIAVSIPAGFVGLMMPRSSITTKTSLMLWNCVGCIDAGYHGPIKFQFRATSFSGVKPYEVGDKIGQLVVVPLADVDGLEEVDDLGESERSDKGFGSTGVK